MTIDNTHKKLDKVNKGIFKYKLRKIVLNEKDGMLETDSETVITPKVESEVSSNYRKNEFSRTDRDCDKGNTPTHHKNKSTKKSPNCTNKKAKVNDNQDDDYNIRTAYAYVGIPKSSYMASC